ncbi:unnamed protein product, partial [Rotaria sp. Silwood1]
MYGFNPYTNSELEYDMWIQTHTPGALNTTFGAYLNNLMGENPNPAIGRILGGYPR